MEIMRLPHGIGLPLPCYGTTGSSGMDVCAALEPGQVVILSHLERAVIPTGFSISIPEGYEVQVRPRSGLSLQHGVSVLNTPGTIDSDYRGEIKVILINFGGDSFEIRRGDRIAQLVVASVVKATWKEVSVLDETSRGADGFGSTG